MAESMIERVAKAIYEKRNGSGCTPWGRQKKVHQAPYLSDAAAAIEAMRTPTEAMLDEGPPEPYMEKHVWARMIDAALKDV
jgi:hypothetical protein